MTPEDAMERQVKALERIASALEAKNTAAAGPSLVTETPAGPRRRYYGEPPQQAEAPHGKARPKQASRS